MTPSRALSTFAPLFALAVTACGARPNLEAPKVIVHDLVEAKYPGNWKLEQSEEKEHGVRTSTFTIEPSDGVFMLLVFSPPVPITLPEFAATMMGSMDEALKEYAVGSVDLVKKIDGTKTPVSRTISGAVREGLRIPTQLSALGEKVPMTIELYGISSEHTSAVAFQQSANEDLERDSPGFAFILDSIRLK